MKNKHNFEEKIKIKDKEIPLLLTVNEIEEPYRKEFLECAKEGIKKYSEVKSYNKEIIEISANVICYSYSSSSMTDSVDDIKLKFFDGSEKSIAVNFGINPYQP